MTDPARLIDREIDAFDDGERQALTGRTLLAELRRNGWRIVRTTPLDPGHFVDARDEKVEITEEWKP